MPVERDHPDPGHPDPGPEVVADLGRQAGIVTAATAAVSWHGGSAVSQGCLPDVPTSR